MKRLALEQIKELYDNENRNILDCEVRCSGSKNKKQTYIKYECLLDGYIGWMSIGNMKTGQGCPICAGNKKLNLEEIKLMYDSEKIEIIDSEIREYGNVKNKATYVKYRCLIDGYEDWKRLDSIKDGQGCSLCGGQVLHDGNRLSLLRPDLVKYFENQEDANNYTVSSGKRVKLKCPDCNKCKNMQISKLSYYGFSCEYCSDGISIPEKFGIYLFKQLMIDVNVQKTFKWSSKKRYDFFIEKLTMIIEVHGMQHYEEINRGVSIKEEQENDKLKYVLAIKNGIESENYIIIDCRKSEFEWLKENYIKSLGNYFNLSNVNWLKVWEDCQKSIVPEIWDVWNNKSENDTTKTIGKIFGLSATTIIKYLKFGNEINKCSYSGKEEISKGRKRLSKPVYQYSLGGEFLKEYKSSKDIEIQLGINPRRISDCCLGKIKSAGGFKWSYNKIGGKK